MPAGSRSRSSVACQSCDDDQRAEQRRGLGAHQPLGEVDEQDLALGEDLPHVEARLGLPEDGPQAGTQQEGPQLVHDRGDGLGAFGLATRPRSQPRTA